MFFMSESRIELSLIDAWYCPDFLRLLDKRIL